MWANPTSSLRTKHYKYNNNLCSFYLCFISFTSDLPSIYPGKSIGKGQLLESVYFDEKFKKEKNLSKLKKF